MTLAVAVSELCGGQAATWQSLFDCHGGLHRIADGRAHYVAREAGLSARQALRFAALVDVVREAGAEPLQPGAALRGAADVYAHFRPLAAEPVETFHVVLLDNKHRFLRTVEVSRGTPYFRVARGAGGRSDIEAFRQLGPLCHLSASVASRSPR